MIDPSTVILPQTPTSAIQRRGGLGSSRTIMNRRNLDVNLMGTNSAINRNTPQGNYNIQVNNPLVHLQHGSGPFSPLSKHKQNTWTTVAEAKKI